MILVEENICKILLVSMTPQQEEMIVDIMEMIVKNQTSDKSCVQDNSINKQANLTYCVPYHIIGKKKCSR